MTNETKWAIDQAHSEISFKVKHLMISAVKGAFKTYDASIYTTDKDFKTAVIDLWIDVSSISTGDEKRDAHLQSADFFDVQNHKQISFVSSTIGEADADGKHELWGELTMVGITHNIKLMVEFGGIAKDPWGNEKAGFTVTGTINRGDWGLVWNTLLAAGGFMVSEEVAISCDIELANVNQNALTMEVEASTDKKGMW